MPANELRPPFPLFYDVDGEPLENGFVYVGVAGENPEVSPIVAYWDIGLAISAAQPLRTIDGYLAQSGSPGRIFVDADDYSITVRDKNGSLVYSSLTNFRALPLSAITGGNLALSVLSIPALIAYGPGKYNGQTITVAFFNDAAPFSNTSGGTFVWQANKDRGTHDGGEVIDVFRPFPSTWTNAGQMAVWLTGGSGLGCWVRQHDGTVFSEWWGVRSYNQDTDLNLADVNGLLMNKFSIVSRGQPALIQTGEILYSTTLDWANKPSLNISGSAIGHGSTSDGTKLCFLPKSAGTLAVDFQNSSNSRLANMEFEGAWDWEHGGTIDPDSVLNTMMNIEDSNYIIFDNVHTNRFGTGYYKDPGSTTTFSVYWKQCNQQGCGFAFDLYKMNQVVVDGGVMSNCGRGFELLEGSSVFINDADWQIQGYVTPADYANGRFEKATSSLFRFERIYNVNLRLYTEVNGNGVVNGTQYHGDAIDCQGFSFGAYAANVSYADATIKQLRFTDCSGVRIEGLSTYGTPPGSVFAGVVSASQPWESIHMVALEANVDNANAKIIDTTFSPILTINGTDWTGTPDASNVAETTYDGNEITVRGLLSVSTLGAGTDPLGIRLPVPVRFSTSAYSAIIFAEGEDGSSSYYRLRVLASDPTIVRIYDQSANSITQNTFTNKTMYFTIRYVPERDVTL